MQLKTSGPARAGDAALKQLRVAACTTALVIVASTGAAGLAHAGEATGWTGYTGTDANGDTYATSSTIITDLTTAKARSNIWTVSAGSAPTGFMGVLPRLFKSGVLCAAPADYAYNSGPAVGIGFDIATSSCGSGSYNSHGAVAVWKGTDYNHYYTFPTVAQNFPS
ncbi:MAG: hypothetical protein QM662_06790 [Gordonia sp. (in: high G+C Gram-positive bacteria)]